MQTNSIAFLTAVYEMELSSDATVETIRKTNVTPPISALVKKTETGLTDKTECFKFIQGMIAIMNQYFGITWSDFQLIEISKELYSRYFYWTLSDWKLFSKKVKGLDYVSDKGMFGMFSPDKLMFWASQYDESWVSCSLMLQQHSHDVHTKDEYRPEYNQDILQREVDAALKKHEEKAKKDSEFWKNTNE